MPPGDDSPAHIALNHSDVEKIFCCEHARAHARAAIVVLFLVQVLCDMTWRRYERIC